MYKEAKYITTVPGNAKKTAYLLCKRSQTLVAMELKDESNASYPEAWVCFEHFMNALKARIIGSRIFKHVDGTYYTYLILKQHNNYVDVNVPIVAALKICKVMHAPIFIHEKIVKDAGFLITKKMIEDTLNENCPAQ